MDHYDYPSSLTSQNLDSPPSSDWITPDVGNESAKRTPATLGWTHGTELLKLSTFIVPNKGQPYFELLSQWTPPSQTPHRVYLDQPKTVAKNSYACQYPGTCNTKQIIFSRATDLTCHYECVHANAKMKDSFPRDYAKCVRSEVTFTRKDHYRDHLRDDVHKEAIGCPPLKRKNKWTREGAQRRWLAERKVSPKHWRCRKCLAKHHVAQVGWDCPSCKMSREIERTNARGGLTRGIPSLDPHDGLGSHQESSDSTNTNMLPAPMPPPTDFRSRNIPKKIASKAPFNSISRRWNLQKKP